MRVTFVSNYINHHQIPISTVLYEKWGDDYHFIQTEPMEEERIKLGWDDDTGKLAYLMCYYENPETCKQLIRDSDVVIFGGTDEEEYIRERLQTGKIVIRYSERLYKNGQWRAISPRGLYKKYIDHTQYRNAPVYLLCAGGYVAHDFHIVHAYEKKRFRWGYFPEFEESTKEERLAQKKGETVRILWAGRFIDWKHPKDALAVALALKEKGYRFQLTLVGGGELEESLKAYAEEHDLKEYVTFAGVCKPEQVRQYMKESHIFLFTSDYKEGWGVVLNEAMNSGCAVVASHAIGAVPFLIRHGENGFIYKSGDVNELISFTGQLCRDEEKRLILGEEAYKTIAEEWNPFVAGQALIELCENAVCSTVTFRRSGPLSEAKMIKQSRMYHHLTKHGR